MGGPGSIFPRDESRHPAGARTGSQGSHQPEARIFRRGLRLRHRSRSSRRQLIDFSSDPEIKAESLWTGEQLGRANAFALRNGPGVRIRDGNGEWRQAYHAARRVRQHDDPLQRSARSDRTIGAARADARLAILRSHANRPRRAGAQAAGRLPIPRCWPADGSDLAAAVQTIRKSAPPERWTMRSPMHSQAARRSQPRPAPISKLGCGSTACCDRCSASELSDGTLRYLLLVAALLSPRPPALMILNEPETSLHPDLLPPLARLIVQASKRSPDDRRLACRMSWSPRSTRAADSTRNSAGKDPRRNHRPGVDVRQPGPGLRDSNGERADRPSPIRSVRRHPGPGFALGRGDLDLGHHLGDFAAHARWRRCGPSGPRG